MENVIVSLGQYIEIVSKLHSEHVNRFFYPISQSFAFRGVSDHTYPLLPSIFRKQVNKISGGGEEVEKHTYISYHNERALLASFIIEASGYVDIPQEDLFRWAEYAQHYGVPTRFLDWTNSPLVALYFACRSKMLQNGAVWLLNNSEYEMFFSGQNISKDLPKTKRDIISQLLEGKSSVEIPICYLPCYVDSRMSAQGSTFMVWGTKDVPLEVTLEDRCFHIISSTAGSVEERVGKILFKIIIPANRKRQLLRELDLAGVNEKTLFPGLDGIGRYIERTFRFDYDEFPDYLYKDVPGNEYYRLLQMETGTQNQDG